MRIIFLQLSFLIAIAGASLASDGKAQAVLETRIHTGESAGSLQNFLEEIEKEYHINFVFSPALIDAQRTVIMHAEEGTLGRVLAHILQPLQLTCQASGDVIVIKPLPPPGLPEVAPTIAMIRPVTGKITDNRGNPLTGVNIRVKGSQTGTVSDNDGGYTISIPDDQAVLVFSMLGFDTQEKTVGTAKTVNIVLAEKPNNLNEVVVIGYGTTKKRDLTGSVGIVNVPDLQKAPVPAFDQALAGRVAGVNVVSGDGQPGSVAAITIRGGSVSQDNSPLYVIDGFPIENMDINSLNPQDIASMEVLKDASSIAIYGARGANGVILITTKRGQPGAPKISYSYQVGAQKATKLMKMMDPYQFVQLQLELDSMRSTPANPVTVNHQIYLDPTTTLASYQTQPGYDWQKLLLRTGVTQQHSLSITGGSEDTRYAFSGSAYNQDGIILNTGMKRYDGRFTLDQNIRKDLKFGMSATYSNTTTYGTIPTSAQTGGVVSAMWQYRPTNGIGGQNLINSLIDSTALSLFLNNGSTGPIGNSVVNPLIQAQNEFRQNVSNTGTINAYLEYTFLKNFKLKVSAGYNGTDLNGEAFYNSQTQQGNLLKNGSGAITNSNGINGSLGSQQNSNYLNEDLLSYHANIGKDHVIDAVAGFTYQYASSLGTGFKSNNIPQSTEYLGILSLNTGTANTPVIVASRSQLYSLLSRVNYTYKDRYLFTGTIRSDGSSKFAPGHQWGYFPSGAVAWRFTEEPSLKGLDKLFTDGKLRVSYGSVGNNRVGDFSYLSQYGALNAGQGYPTNNTYQQGIAPYFYGNSDLTWETSTELDLGLDFSILKDRISISTDYYDKRTKNFLLSVTLPELAGYSVSANTQYQNVGSLDNRGFEFTINTVNINSKNFSWTSNFNISFNASKILSFYNGVQNKQTPWGMGSGSATAWIAQVGGPISEFYGYKWGGIYQYTDFNKLGNGTYVLKPGVPTYSANVQPGDPKYQDLNHDGVVDANDETTLGSPLPVATLGFSNNFTYKNFYLNVFFQGTLGNKVLDANKIAFESTGSYFVFSNEFADYANRWTPTNPTNDIPRARYNTQGDAGSADPRPSSWDIENGSFVRLKTVSFGYNIPGKLVSRLGLSAARVFISAENLLTFTKYPGEDPEVSTFRTTNPGNAPTTVVGPQVTSGTGGTFIQPSSSYSALAQGYDFTAYPRAMTFIMGIQVSF